MPETVVARRGGTQWQDDASAAVQDSADAGADDQSGAWPAGVGDHMRHGSEPTRAADARDFDRRVRQVVATLLAGGPLRPLHVHHVAESVRTSPRTLQRRLHGAGLTYARVVQQVRFEIARRMLRDPAQKIRDVARTLGYSDPAHFTRAFQRWTGLTPRDFRRRRLDDAGGDPVPRARGEPMPER